MVILYKNGQVDGELKVYYLNGKKHGDCKGFDPYGELLEHKV